MARLVSRILFACMVAGAFYVSGHLAVFCENWHDSLVTSSAVFSVSFLSMVGSAFKLLYA